MLNVCAEKTVLFCQATVVNSFKAKMCVKQQCSHFVSTLDVECWFKAQYDADNDYIWIRRMNVYGVYRMSFFYG